MTQTPPLISRLIQGYLDHTRIEECPYHQMDHGVRDPECDHCKRALGPLYHHKIVGNRHLPVFTFDFSGPHPHTVNMAQYLLISVWSLGHMRIIWAFGVESRQSDVVLPCLQSCFQDLRALTGGSRPPILSLHSKQLLQNLHCSHCFGTNEELLEIDVVGSAKTNPQALGSSIPLQTSGKHESRRTPKRTAFEAH